MLDDNLTNVEYWRIIPSTFTSLPFARLHWTNSRNTGFRRACMCRQSA